MQQDAVDGNRFVQAPAEISPEMNASLSSPSVPWPLDANNGGPRFANFSICNDPEKSASGNTNRNSDVALPALPFVGVWGGGTR